MLIREGELRRPEVEELLTTHLDFARFHSPACSVHALDLDKLEVPEITFLTAWEGNKLMGCGALKELNSHHGEIKSMHTAEVFRGKGVAVQLLTHIMDLSRQRLYQRLSLETGSMEAFAPARALYSRFGFEDCEPFGSYFVDINSQYMTCEL